MPVAIDDERIDTRFGLADDFLRLPQLLDGRAAQQFVQPGLQRLQVRFGGVFRGLGAIAKLVRGEFAVIQILGAG